MIKIIKIFFCVAPFLITILFLLVFQNNKKIIVKNEPEKVKIQNSLQDTQELEKWSKNLDHKLEKLQKDQVIIKKDTKIYALSDLNENKKLLLKIVFLHKLQKELEEFDKNKNHQSLQIPAGKIQEMIVNYKQKLYNNNRNMNLLDKNFLDNLNVYIQY